MIRRTIAVFGLLFCLLGLTAICGAQDKAHWSVTPPSGSPKAGDTVTLNLEATIDKGWHVYGLVKSDGPTPLVVEAVGGANLAGPVIEGKPIKKLDTNFGVPVEYFEDKAEFKVPVKLGAKGLVGSLRVHFQTCNASTCVPPQIVEIPISGGAAPGTAHPKASASITHREEKKGLLEFIGLAFGAGLLSLLTPCVFPMVPITVSFFTKQRASGGARASLGAGICLLCGNHLCIRGVRIIVTALFGASGVQRFATNPWVNLVLAIVFIFLALNLFGIVEISLPSSIQNLFSPQGKTGLAAPILMGLTFTLTSFTCTSPFVGTILVSAANGSYLYPLVGMLTFGAAFALPFFFLAIFPQFLSRLPRSGSWLEMVKAFMGFLEIAAAVKFISNADLVLQTGLISRPTFLVLWAVILWAAAFFLLGVLPVGRVEVPKKMGLGRMFTIGLTAVCSIALLWAIPSNRSLGEVEAFLPPTKSAGWTDDYSKALTLARQTNRPVLINFTGVTCTNCRDMEKNILSRPDVGVELHKFVLVELYTDRNNPGDVQNGQLEQKLTGEVTLPFYVAVNPDGSVKKSFGGSTHHAEEFVSFLQQAEASGS